MKAPVHPIDVEERNSASVDISTLPAVVVVAFGVTAPAERGLHTPD